MLTWRVVASALDNLGVFVEVNADLTSAGMGYHFFGGGSLGCWQIASTIGGGTGESRQGGCVFATWRAV